MPSVKFGKDFITSRNRLNAGWYTLVVGPFTEENSKGGDSINWVGQFTVKTNDANNGTVVKHWFNEKAPGRVTDYLVCFVGGDLKRLEEVGAGKDVIELLNQTAGKEIQGYAKYDLDRKWNTIDDFRPISTAAQGGSRG